MKQKMCGVARLALVVWGCLLGGAGGCSTGPDASGSNTANVTGVSVSGGAGNYTFSVSIASDDTGCDRYADWWEVLSADGMLQYRRILAHSHVDEQPFTRSGGPVAVAEDTQLIVRAHLHSESGGGYGGNEYVGSVGSGFAPADSLATLPPAVETVAPQPDGCAF